MGVENVSQSVGRHFEVNLNASADKCLQVCALVRGEIAQHLTRRERLYMQAMSRDLYHDRENLGRDD